MGSNVIVIGAGIAGLAAGYQLKKAGCSPVVLEAESFAGGRMSSEEYNGFIIDKGAYTFPEFHKNLRGIVQELGLQKHLLPTPGTSSTFSGGEEYRIKIGSPMDFLKYRLLTGRNKKELLRLYLYAQSLGKALDLADPTKKTFELERESVSEYLLENFDEQILEKIAYPVFVEIFLGLPENNSKLAFLATLKNLARFKIFSFSEGMGMVPDRLNRDIEVQLNSPVLRVAPLSKEGSYQIHVGGDKPRSYLADGVILAIPLPLVSNIVDGLPAELIEGFQNVHYTPSIVTALGVDKRYRNTAMINSLLRKDFQVLGNVVFDDHKSPQRVPSGKSLVTAVLCEPASRSLLDESDERVSNAVLGELDALYPGLSNKLIFSKVYRWVHGAVQLWPGSVRKQHATRKLLERFPGNLLFAGDGLYKSSLEIAFNTGIEAANRLIGRLVS
jgi:oxygen-dependent protoporphyrinogen oxidase